MAEIQTFHGLRYNCQKVGLADVLAPPYDVIKGAMRDELVARSEYNIVEVELPAGADDAKYEKAATILHDWREQDILTRDDAAFYIYEQEFDLPGSGEKKQRRGVLGALTLEEFGKGVQPHEHTLSGPKQDRLNLLRATRTNTSPIFGLFADDDGWVEGLLTNACTDKPICEAKDADGITHRLWRVTDDETVNAIEAALEDEPILIADGHHRYETALNYRNERMAEAGDKWTGGEPENAVLMMCVSTANEGLVVLPTHRLVKNVENSKLSGLLSAVAAYFDVETMPASSDAPALIERLNDDAATTPRLGLHLKGQSYLLQLKSGDAHLDALHPDRSAAYNNLDVTILHTLVLQRNLGIGPEELAAGNHVAYTIDASEAFAKVDAGDYGAAFLMRPTPVEQVQQVAAAGDKMPQKSTYFYPKLVTGMVLRSLDAA